MRFLFTADWQAEFDNLDLCEQVAEDVLRICDEYNLEGFVVAGDLKRAYNPVDVRVTNFWMDFIHKACKRKLEVILVLGNHDRVGMYSEAHNWFPSLAKAGAHAVAEEPGVFNVKKGTIACLPFASSVDRTRQMAKQLASRVKKGRGEDTVLVFHNDLKGCAYNVLGNKSDARLKLSDISPDAYDYCFGGHIHLSQHIGENVDYVGSPFCSDWGEANQRKSYIVVTDGRAQRIPSSAPNWYDPTWPGFPKYTTFLEGTRIRIHVPIEVGKNYSAVLDKARSEAENKYKGATIYAVPEFKESEKSNVTVKATDSDADKIFAYVEETLPEVLRKRHEFAINRYLLYKLTKASAGLGMRAGGRIEFLSAKAKRFLCFPELEVDFREKGLVLITGKNKDWLGRSNGVGKTSLLQTVPVALFGKTFKDQKHDAWACDKIKGQAWVSLKFKDSKNRHIKVFRSRRPGKLRLFVNGKEQSSGMQSTSQSGTQGLVEKMSGFTWQTLANAVYIDQEQVNAFLAGTQAEQKKILERFQNLERFTVAQELVNKDLNKKTLELSDASDEVIVANAKVETCREVLAEDTKRKEPEIQVKQARIELHHAKVELNKLHKKIKHTEMEYEGRLRGINESIKFRQNKSDKWQKIEDKLQVKRSILEERLETTEQIDAVCPTCLQKVNTASLKKHMIEWKQSLTIVIKKLRGIVLEVKLNRNRIDELIDEQAGIGQVRATSSNMLHDAEKRVIDGEKHLRVVENYLQQKKSRQLKLEHRLRKAEKTFAFWTKHLTILEEEKAFLEYCVQAFSRKGIPAFLNAQICPQLNKAAEEYAEIFADREIQVRFEVNDGEFEVQILNAHGGKTITDQSAGEKKMAAIIASFALRSIATPSNLLVLDEPGDGLDASNAKAFAVGLKRMKDRLGTVLLTTHNPYIVSELSGEQSITIEKKGGLSHVA